MTIFKRLLLLVPFLLLLVPSVASAETATPQWTVSSVSRPTTFAATSEEDSYVVLVTNSGGAVAGCTQAQYKKELIATGHTVGEVGVTSCPEDSPVVNSITITDELPAGLKYAGGATAEDELGGKTGGASSNFSHDCAESGDGDLSCTYTGVVQPGDALFLRIPVKVSKAEAETVTSSGPQTVTNIVRTSGGGAPGVGFVETPTAVAASEAAAKAQTVFGIAQGGAHTALSSVQAGAHADLTTLGAFDTLDPVGATAGSVKDVVDQLPAGFAGDLRDTPACQAQLFLEEACPIPTQVGITTQIVDKVGINESYLRPVYNLAPEPGDVAKIGFNIGNLYYVGNVAVRAPGEACPTLPAEGSNLGAPTACEPYGLQTTFDNVTGDTIDYDAFSLTIWGVPAAAIHDPLRCEPGNGCVFLASGVADHSPEAPYFTNPTACTSEPLHAELRVTSWEEREPGGAGPVSAQMPFDPVVGCDRLLMEPVLTAQVTSDAAYSATGFDLDTSIPQTYDNANGLATSTLKQEVVTLPEGMTVNPSSGAGLGSCSEAQYAEELAPAKTAEEKEQGHGCPNNSKLATVKIKTPAIEEELEGSAYLATPYQNPFPEPARAGEAAHPNGSLLVLYLVARAKNRGVLVKAAGLVQPNQETGRLTTTFGPTPAFNGQEASPGLPPLPASDIKFEFNPGANAPLVTPPTCGDYTVEAALTPWATPENVLDPSIRPFPITTGVGGGSCPAGGVPPFNPGVTAGTENNDAGSYSPLDIRISRNDGEQEITGFASALPLGLTGNLSGIPFCGEAEIQRAREQTGVEDETSPACPAGSEIGYSVADAGVGTTVLAQAPGKLYLGGSFDGAPFSIVSITAAHVGPFDLGTVVIHFPLDINPETADVTIPASPTDRIPHIIKGIVIHVREIRAFVNRAKFMLNPTSCNPFNFSATVIGGGADPTNPAGYDPVTVSTPFRVTACQALKFEPKFAVSTQGKTSKADGASLHVALTYPTGALTNDANIKEVKVELPEALPSRLTTLQKACLQKEFRANPAGCPPESVIGHAKAITPILPVPLEGPVYFVSNGGEAFPNLIMVLQGDGVTIDLVGDTFISPAGITSSTFKTVPDQPVTSFELTLPEGKFSALGTNKNLCSLTKTVTTKKTVKEKVKGKTKKVVKKTTKTVATPLVMPTKFIGQNGAEVNQSTPVSVTGCAKAKVAKKAKKKAKGKGKKGKKKK
jgi:hypothetical protein